MGAVDTLPGMNATEIGDMVRAERQRQGLSLRDMAERCGHARNNTRLIRKVEAGEEYNHSTLATVCQALGLEVVVRKARKKVTDR